MVYDEVTTLDDLLIYASLVHRGEPTTETKLDGKPIPLWYEVTYYFKNKGRAWRATFTIRILDNTPELQNITIGGLDEFPFPIWALTKWKNKEKLTEAERKRLITYSENRLTESVQRYQTDLIAKYQTKLLDRAVLMGFNHSARQTYTPKELKQLTKQIQATTRRKVTPALLNHVASIYLRAETSFPKANPIEEIMDELKVSHRRAQEYAQYARAQGYLPTPKQIKRKVNKQTKKKG